MIPPAPPPGADGEHVLYCDGASRGNPGDAAFGFALYDPTGAEIAAAGSAIGRHTNNVAEYTSLIRGLEHAAALGVSRIRVRMDSELVVRQMLGVYRVKHAGLKPLHDAAQRASAHFSVFRIEHVPRAQNSRADGLANAALDALRSQQETDDVAP
jgi:ribonuclease HI